MHADERRVKTEQSLGFKCISTPESIQGFNRPVAKVKCKMATQMFNNDVGVSDQISGMVQQLSAILDTIVTLELAVLIGSRATGAARPDSDWDIAIQWCRGMNFVQQLAATEQLRRTLAEKLGKSEQGIDLIDLPTARLTMRAVVAEEGLPIRGGDSLAWHRFLQRTWRELEEQYWEQTYAA